MPEFRYGPVEFFLLGMPEDRPAPDVVAELGRLVATGLVRILDFVVIGKSEEGEIVVTEIEEDDDRFGLTEIEIVETGLSGSEDIDQLAERIEPGTSAALVALELTFARGLAATLAGSGGVVLAHERIPAPIVNAVVDAAEQEVVA